jgi:uncharacterized membrane protein
MGGIAGASKPSAHGPASAANQGPNASASSTDVRGVLNKYCVGCHNSRVKTTATANGVVFDTADLARIANDSAMWEKAIRKLRANAMPPAGLPRPDVATHDTLVSFLETTLDRAAAEHPNPGRPITTPPESRRVRQRDSRSARTASGHLDDAAAR